MLIVTYKCNLNCVYCYEPKKLAHRMTIDTAKNVIMSQLASLDSEYDKIEIQFMGGEPLIEYNLIKELSEWLWTQDWGQRELVLFASTNGTLLDDEMKAWFSKNNDRIVLGLSFDGNALMQNVNRSHSSNYVDVDYFSSTWPNQSIKMTVSPYTVPSLSEGVTFLHSKGVKYIIADLATGNKVKWTVDSLEMYSHQLNKLIDFYLKNPNISPFSLLNLDIYSVARRQDIRKSCSCGEDLTCFDWDGKPYACHLFSPVTMPLEQAIRAREEIDFHNYNLFMSPKCNNCVLVELCNSCPGMNYICSGDVSQPSLFHCRAFKIEFAANCKFQLHKAYMSGDNAIINRISRIVNNIKL